MNQNKVILAGSVYTPDKHLSQVAVFIEGARIAGLIETPRREAITESYRKFLLESRPTAPFADTAGPGLESWMSAEWIEAWDRILVPGFIEVHTNGAGGYDAMDTAPDTLSNLARVLARFGTTTFLPTLITAPKPDILQGLASLAKAMGAVTDGAAPVGIHLEGPFLSRRKRGAHSPEHLQRPTRRFLMEAVEAAQGHLKILTLAPELRGALPVISAARRAGVIPALGHSDATYEQTLQGIDAGACHSVHMFNAMRPFNHREPGIIGAILNDDRISAEIITDGIHVHPLVIKTLLRAKRLDKIILSTDSISAAAMPDGEYMLSGKRITVIGGACRDEEGRLAGSSLTQDRALRNLMEWSGVSPQEALGTATLNPAQLLGLSEKGVIRPGADADLVLMSEGWQVERTLVGGRTIYQRGDG